MDATTLIDTITRPTDRGIGARHGRNAQGGGFSAALEAHRDAVDEVAPKAPRDDGRAEPAKTADRQRDDRPVGDAEPARKDESGKAPGEASASKDDREAEAVAATADPASPTAQDAPPAAAQQAKPAIVAGHAAAAQQSPSASGTADLPAAQNQPPLTSTPELPTGTEPVSPTASAPPIVTAGTGAQTAPAEAAMPAADTPIPATVTQLRTTQNAASAEPSLAGETASSGDLAQIIAGKGTAPDGGQGGATNGQGQSQQQQLFAQIQGGTAIADSVATPMDAADFLKNLHKPDSAALQPILLTGAQPSGPSSSLLSTTALMTASHAGATPQPASEQVVLRLQKAIADGNDRISMSLKPAHLGRVDVQLDLGTDGRVQATVSADRPETLTLLQRDVRSLEQALQNAGLQADSDSLNFNLRQQAHDRNGGGGHGFGDGNGNGQEQGNGESSPPPPSRRVSLGGIDLKV